MRRSGETVASYAHCADSGRFDDFAALFAADGVLEVHGRGAAARAATRSARTSAASDRDLADTSTTAA